MCGSGPRRNRPFPPPPRPPIYMYVHPPANSHHTAAIRRKCSRQQRPEQAGEPGRAAGRKQARATPCCPAPPAPRAQAAPSPHQTRLPALLLCSSPAEAQPGLCSAKEGRAGHGPSGSGKREGEPCHVGSKCSSDGRHRASAGRVRKPHSLAHTAELLTHSLPTGTTMLEESHPRHHANAHTHAHDRTQQNRLPYSGSPLPERAGRHSPSITGGWAHPPLPHTHTGSPHIAPTSNPNPPLTHTHTHTRVQTQSHVFIATPPPGL